MRNERGQVLPLWIVAILSTFVLMFMALNYGNTIRWQIRAQNAADAAAQGLLSIQTERWNMTLETLYAANVEEFRIRRLLDGILLTTQGSGGCEGSTVVTTSSNVPPADCSADFMTLTNAYLKAVARYTADVTAINDVSSYSTYTNWNSDKTSLLTHLQSVTACNSPDEAYAAINPAGGDCAFKYSVLMVQPRTGLYPVEYDALGVCIPDSGRTCDAALVDSENADFQPISIDIIACAIVPPIIPNFFGMTPQTYYAVGRGAATEVMFEQDWFQPGSLYDNVRGPNQPFQPTEDYALSADTSGPVDWYDVNFGGNQYTAYPGYNLFNTPLTVDTFEARVGWWNAVPVRPFAPAADVDLTTQCK